MKILTLNCGSSSVKYGLFSFPEELLLKKGLIEKIGERGSKVKNHLQAIEEIFSSLLKEKLVSSYNEIYAVGHRIVQGREVYQEPVIITRAVISNIKKFSEFAPLHNPHNLAGIMAVSKITPYAKQVGVFDTAYYNTLKPWAKIYALPYEISLKYKIKRYGFHGISHQFLAQEGARIIGKSLKTLKIITCHLGNGCSITAVNKAKVVDTSMGFTPLEGLVMGTRCGDIDVAAVFYLLKKMKKTPDKLLHILNYKSGIKGVSGISNDFRQIKEAIKKGNFRAKLAYEMFIWRLKKYIGAYFFILGGADLVVLSGGIGENSEDILREVKKTVKKISPRTKILVIPTNEELMIARQTYKKIK